MSKKPPWLKKRKNPFKIARGESKLYNTVEWRKISIEHRKNNPTCVECGKAFIEYKGNTVCDHIIPVAQRGAIYDSRNHQTLCKRCHGVKSGKDKAPYNGEFEWIEEEGKRKRIPIIK